MLLSSKDEKLEQIIARVPVIIAPENIDPSTTNSIRATLLLEYGQLRAEGQRTSLWMYYIHVLSDEFDRPFYMSRNKEEALRFFEYYKEKIEAGEYTFELRK